MPTLRILAGDVVQPGPFSLDRDGVWSIDADPDDVLDYVVDFTGWLKADTITGTPTTTPSGITETSQSNTTTSVTSWLTGVTDPRGTVLVSIVTTGGRTKQFSFRVKYAPQAE